jgi:hypothetical protein
VLGTVRSRFVQVGTRFEQLKYSLDAVWYSLKFYLLEHFSNSEIGGRIIQFC